MKRGGEQLTACGSEFFAAGAAFGSCASGEFAVAAEAFIKRSLGAGAEQDLETTAEFFDAAGEIHLVNVAVGVQGGKGQIMLRRKRAEQSFFDRPFRDEDKYLHLLFLAHTIGACDALFQHGGVPGKIDVDHRVRGLQVQSGRACVRRQKQAAPGVRLKFMDQPRPEVLRD